MQSLHIFFFRYDCARSTIDDLHLTRPGAASGNTTCWFPFQKWISTPAAGSAADADAAANPATAANRPYLFIFNILTSCRIHTTLDLFIIRARTRHGQGEAAQGKDPCTVSSFDWRSAGRGL